jgi:hypothetical protein
MAIFPKTNVMYDHFVQKIAVVSAKKRQIFRRFFRRKYFKNHNIGPWSSKHFWRKKPSKKSANLHPRQGNLLQRNIFTELKKTLVTTQNGLETS